ncbi:MAG TPA: sialidase family protein [Vicinamibacterales bacterium]|nr:sialidase family protein [Vicinamibacterales bacterium]
MTSRTTIIVAAACFALIQIASAQTPSTLVKVGQPTTLGLPGAVNATPSLAVVGRAIAAVWSVSRDGAADVYLAMSSDGGATFSPPRRVNDQAGDASANNEQPPRVVMTGPASARAVTVVWSKRNEEGAQRSRRDAVRMARSTDGGRTFSPARFTHDPAASGARGWESLTVGSDGSVHVVSLDGRDAGRKMAEHAKQSGIPHKGQPPQDIYHATIAPDGGIAESLIATGVCFCCKTAVAVNARGVVYAAWRHIFPGSMRDIAFATSRDGGRSFDPLVRVSEDNWELNGCPEDGPTLAVDRAGVIHIAWATVVNGAEPEKALFYATSRDGKIFSARARLPVASGVTPGHPQLTLTADGGAAIVWDEVVSGVRRVAATRVSRAGVVQPAEILSGVESASNPVIAGTEGAVVAAWTSRSPTGKIADPAQIKIVRIRAS